MREILEAIDEADARPASRSRSRPSSRRSARRRASRARRWSSARTAGSSARSRAAASRPTWSSARRQLFAGGEADARPLRRHRRRGLGGRALLRRRDRRLARARRPRALARGARAARRGRVRDALHGHRRPARSASSAASSRARGLRDDGIFAEVDRGPAARRHLRRRRGRRAPLRLRAGSSAGARRSSTPGPRSRRPSGCRAPTR